MYFTSVVVDLNSGLPILNPKSGHRGLVLGASELQVQHSNHDFHNQGSHVVSFAKKRDLSKNVVGRSKKNYAHSASPLVHLMHVAKCYLLLQVIGN